MKAFIANVLKTTVACVAAAQLRACVSVPNRPLNAAAAQAISEKMLAHSRYAKPDFTAMTAGKAGFGLIGAVLMITSGNKLIAENNVEDPAAYISAALGDYLKAQYGARIVAANDKQAPTDDLGSLVVAYPHTQLLLDVKTIDWRFTYFPAIGRATECSTAPGYD